MHVALFPPSVAPVDVTRAAKLGRIHGICDCAFGHPPDAFAHWCSSDLPPGTLMAFRRAYSRAYAEAAS